MSMHKAAAVIGVAIVSNVKSGKRIAGRSA